MAYLSLGFRGGIGALAALIVLSICQSSAAQTAAEQELAYIRKAIDRQQYDEALSLLADLQRSDQCESECRGEGHFLTALCRYMMGHQDAARVELEEALRIWPKHTLEESKYPDGFVQLYRQAERKKLCSLEIRILTPHSLGFKSGGKLKVVFQDDRVPVGPVELVKNDYSRSQRYRLNAGQLNVFELKLEELHDYWAFDSLHLMFRPNLSVRNNQGKGGQPEEDDSCVRIGSRCFNLLESNYDELPVTRIVVGEGDWIRSIYVMFATSEWKELHKDLASNRNRHRLARILKISSIAGTVGATAWAFLSDSKAGDKYEEYMDATDRVQISALYRTYEDLVEQRNILTISAIGLAALGIITYVFSPGDEQDILDEFERRHGSSGLSLGAIDGGMAVQLKLGVL